MRVIRNQAEIAHDDRTRAIFLAVTKLYEHSKLIGTKRQNQMEIDININSCINFAY